MTLNVEWLFVPDGLSEYFKNPSNPEADELQQQKTTQGAAPVSQEQETEDTIHTGSPKLDNKRLEKRCLV